MADEQVAEASAEPVTQPSGETDQTDWKAGLPDDLRDNQSLQTIPDVNALAKSYVNAQSMIGADKIAIPGNWASDDDWSAVYDKLGRPETSDLYELNNDGLPEGQEADQELMNWYRDTVHSVGLTPNQAQKFLTEYNTMLGTRLDGSDVDIEARNQETTKELQAEYGKALPSRIEAANAMRDKFGAKGITELRLEDGTVLGDHPAAVKAFIEVANYINTNMGEDTLVGDKQSMVMTPDEAQLKINEMQRQDSPYWDGKHPQHDFYVQEVARLMEYVVPQDEA